MGFYKQYYVIIFFFKMTCSIARKDDIGLFVNCDLSDTDKNLVSYLIKYKYHCTIILYNIKMNHFFKSTK